MSKEDEKKGATIRVSMETYRELINAKAVMEMEYGRIVTMDEVIRKMLEKMPRIGIKFIKPEEEGEEGGEEV